MTRSLLLVVLILFITGCPLPTPEPLIKYETIEVMVPVRIAPTPPLELIAPLHAPFPVFISPADPGASSALDKDGEEKLKRLLLTLRDRERAWRAWAKE